MLHARLHALSYCFTAVLLGVGSAQAENLWPVSKNVSIELGSFLVDTETTVRLDGTTREIGTEVNFGDEFGFKDQNRFRVDGYWRFLDRHKVRFLYFNSSLSSTRNVSRDIEFGDVTFPLNTSVKGGIDIDIIEVAYEYSFIHRETFELSGSFGLHNISITASLKASASSNVGAGGIARDSESKAEGDGPLPVIGLRGIWALSDHFYFDGQAQFFAIKVDDYDGSLSDYKLSFVWQPLRNLGVGVGYNDFTTRLDVRGRPLPRHAALQVRRPAGIRHGCVLGTPQPVVRRWWQQVSRSYQPIACSRSFVFGADPLTRSRSTNAQGWAVVDGSLTPLGESQQSFVRRAREPSPGERVSPEFAVR